MAENEYKGPLAEIDLTPDEVSAMTAVLECPVIERIYRTVQPQACILIDRKKDDDRHDDDDDGCGRKYKSDDDDCSGNKYCWSYNCTPTQNG